MQKEILTMEKVKKDLAIFNKDDGLNIASKVVVFILSLVMIVLIFLIGKTVDLTNGMRVVYWIVIIAFALTSVGFCFVPFLQQLLRKRIGEKGSFHIEKCAVSKKKRIASRGSTEYTFWFGRHGKISLSEVYNKNLDDIYKDVSIENMFRTLELGDVFYVVCTRRGRALLAYSAKYYMFPDIEN